MEVLLQLEFNINEKTKCVYIWLRNDEKDNGELRESLKPVYRRYHDQKYKVCVFESGSGDLYENTKALLLENRRRLAEREVQREKAQRATSMEM